MDRRRWPSRTLANWGMSATAVSGIVERHRAGEQDFGNLIWMLLVLQKTLESS